ncbi:CFI-box-CTERM domain-containing protein [Argonema antarcticum]|uniref:CFI-box-CTERM domain-containing protein n=1 Tax=Argonema antarcticum TaxID=2942763 RepID=UPI002011940D|nr:CFI-box-CTERM domain-containing protein [Argonema antarcticum]MCL1474981.1 hypothetical protein [Argonema antarcticum A004/B2]
MTSPYQDMIENFTRSLDRGDFYQNNKKYQQALQEYANALSSLHVAVMISENVNRRNNQVYYELETRITYLFLIATVLGKITTCYASMVHFKESSYILSQEKEIVSILARYERSFSAKNLNNYEACRENISLNESRLTIQEALLQQGSSIQEINLDEISKKIRETIKDISKLELCGFMLTDGTSTSSSCFIATAAYSTSTHPDLDTFRNFRDEKLLTNPLGKRLVNLYYQISPSIAQYVGNQPTIKSFVRQQLERLAQWMRN